jgi:predicted DsbA family dithiol-disulfide isomerase
VAGTVSGGVGTRAEFYSHEGPARPSTATVSVVSAVRIIEFTDPGCPWAYSAEPFRRRLDWLYGDALTWDVRMVGLSDSPEHYLEMGFTPEAQSDAFRRIAHDHGMPIDTAVRPRMAATMPACRAVVATRLQAPDRMRPLLRRLRVRTFSGELLDDPATIDGAARDAGIDPAALARWTEDPATAEALAEDMAMARRPLPAALVLDARLANWSGGRRYTCPSYEIERRDDGVRIAVPGFQPFAAYDVIMANLVPGVRRADPAASAEEVLRWTGTPLATKEVAVVRDIPFDAAREELGRVAVEEHVGADGFWTLPG